MRRVIIIGAALGLLIVSPASTAPTRKSLAALPTTPTVTDQSASVANDADSAKDNEPHQTSAVAPKNSVDDLELYVLHLLNRDRAKLGAPALLLNPELSKLSRDYANQMVAQNVFGSNDKRMYLVQQFTEADPSSRDAAHSSINKAMSQSTPIDCRVKKLKL